MAKKVKYYGVFVKRNAEDELPKEVRGLINMLSNRGESVTLRKPVTKVFIFDNELEQIECLANVNGTVVEPIDAVDKEGFMKKAEYLKDKYSDKEEEADDSCHKPD